MAAPKYKSAKTKRFVNNTIVHVSLAILAFIWVFLLSGLCSQAFVQKRALMFLRFCPSLIHWITILNCLPIHRFWTSRRCSWIPWSLRSFPAWLQPFIHWQFPTVCQDWSLSWESHTWIWQWYWDFSRDLCLWLQCTLFSRQQDWQKEILSEWRWSSVIRAAQDWASRLPRDFWHNSLCCGWGGNSGRLYQVAGVHKGYAAVKQTDHCLYSTYGVYGTVAGFYFCKGNLPGKLWPVHHCHWIVENAGKRIYWQLVYKLCGRGCSDFHTDCDSFPVYAEILCRWSIRRS